MKRKIFALCFIGLISSGFLFAQNLGLKESFFQKITSKYGDVKELSANFEMNMSVMGTSMKMPMKMWVKGNKLRVDATTHMPGMDQAMQITTLLNDKNLITYNSFNNTIMTVNLSDFSDEIKKKLWSNNNFIFGSDIEIWKKIKDKVTVEEVNKDGKKFYLITVANLEAIQNSMNIPVNTPMLFKKLLYWLDYESLMPVKMELYGETETPGMWIDFLEIKMSGVPDSIFDVKFPDNAKKMDMTEAFKGMLPK
ncbi:MAG TPA: hypothetical protein PLL89_02925 [bacterium]|uniref:DUF4412 domain-containing protein n=1 Tax=candidate division TA06 bacterium ADurb.Bin131 TaxID=1852827 RepID=A0A1V6C4V2_UNCT6|nr:MAG: hypothetical protein BWX89_01509 [candidate division TA06 bacterium ADurb.Bin131]HOQ81996.1 hypothetical protein [bacterium]